VPAAASPRCCGPTTSPPPAPPPTGCAPAPPTPPATPARQYRPTRLPTADLSEATADNTTGPTAAVDRRHALPGQAARRPIRHRRPRRPSPSLRDQTVNARTVTPPARPGWQLLPASMSCLTCGRKSPSGSPSDESDTTQNAGALTVAVVADQTSRWIGSILYVVRSSNAAQCWSTLTARKESVSLDVKRAFPFRVYGRR
jgi:hypothetical protein